MAEKTDEGDGKVRNMMKKYRILILTELLLVLLSLYRCFAGEELVYTTTGERFAGEDFPLSPGVYQVRAVTEAPQGASVFLGAEASDSSFQALRCNGVSIWENQEYVDFEIYVLDTVDNAHIVCGDNSVLTSLEIYRTSMGGRMLCFCILMGSILLNGVILFRDRVIAGKVSTQTQRAFWVLLLSIALAYFPYATDYYSIGGDFAFHMLRIEGLKETLMHGGQFPVRVQSYWLYEHGYAVSTFYGDFFLFIPALLRLIGFSLMTSYKLFVLLAAAATALAAYYSLRKCAKNDSAALFGSVLYVLAPYRVYNVYNRVAVGEYMAMVFLPLVICGIYRLYTERTDTEEYAKAKIPLIIGLSGILQSHLLTCEMTVVGILLVCLIKIRKTLCRHTFIQLLQAAAICLLLNCWFWLPLLQMMGMDAFYFQDLVNHDIQEKGTWLAGIFQIWPSKGGYQTGMLNCEPIQIGAAFLFMLGAFWVLYIRKMMGKKKGTVIRNPYDKSVFFFAAGSTLLVAMGTNLFPWDFLARIPGVRYLVTALQFPTRMLSPASAFCAMFAAFFLLWVWEEKIFPCGQEVYREFIKGMYCAILLLGIFSEVFHVNSIAYEYPPVRLYNAENMGSVGVLNGEYLLEGTSCNDYGFHDPAAEEGLEWQGYSKKGTNISVYVQNNTDGELSLELPIIGYKGYGINCAEEARELPYIAEERGGHGDLKVMVPPGYSGELRISYKGFASYRVAEIISAVTLLCIGGCIGRNVRKRNALKRNQDGYGTGIRRV